MSATDAITEVSSVTMSKVRCGIFPMNAIPTRVPTRTTGTRNAAVVSTDWSLRHNLSQALTSAALWMHPQSMPAFLTLIDKASADEKSAQWFEDVWQRVRTTADIRQTLQQIST